MAEGLFVQHDEEAVFGPLRGVPARVPEGGVRAASLAVHPEMADSAWVVEWVDDAGPGAGALSDRSLLVPAHPGGG